MPPSTSRDDASVERRSRIQEALTRARVESGLTVDRAALKIGISRDQLWRLENSEGSSITVDRLIQMAEIYGVDAGKLILGVVSAAPPPIFFDRIAAVITMIERELAGLPQRPAPAAIATAVMEILKLESHNYPNSGAHSIDPTGYAGLFRAWLVTARKTPELIRRSTLGT